MSDFTLHWSRVTGEVAARAAGPGMALIALWPAPVNPDACFAAAGFTEFGDADEPWEREADALLGRLLDALGAFGAARLLSEPLRTRPGVVSRLLGARGETLPLAEQIAAPLHHDSLPDARVAFGDAVRLRTGSGHHLFWITLPAADADNFVASTLPRLAGAAPVCRTDLDWTHLWR